MLWSFPLPGCFSRPRPPMPLPDSIAQAPLPGDVNLERMIEARVAIRAEADAIRWRMRLVGIEAIMLALLVGIAGTLVHQPLHTALFSAFMVGGACLISGLMLVGLSASTSFLLSRIRRWRAK